MTTKTAILNIENSTPENFEALKTIHDIMRKQSIQKYNYIVKPSLSFLDNQRFINFLKDSKQELILTAPGITSKFPYLTGMTYNEAMHEIGGERALYQLFFDQKPQGFIPKSWLLNERIEKALTDLDFNYCASREKILNLKTNKEKQATHVRIEDPKLDGQVLQIAIDPTLALRNRPTIENTLEKVKQEYTIISYDELLKMR